MKALHSIFQQWNTQATCVWNISRESCSGSAMMRKDLKAVVTTQQLNAIVHTTITRLATSSNCMYFLYVNLKSTISCFSLLVNYKSSGVDVVCHISYVIRTNEFMNH